MISYVKFVSVPTTNQDRALAFWTERVGFRLLTDHRSTRRNDGSSSGSVRRRRGSSCSVSMGMDGSLAARSTGRSRATASSRPTSRWSTAEWSSRQPPRRNPGARSPLSRTLTAISSCCPANSGRSHGGTTSADALLSAYPDHVQRLAHEARDCITRWLPDASEKIDVPSRLIAYGHGAGLQCTYMYAHSEQDGHQARLGRRRDPP